MPPRSSVSSVLVEIASVARSDTRISPKVAYGRVSGAMPSISSGRSRGRRLRRRARGRSDSPPRSSLGARLRTRWPQYGHSVTYGLTSDPQFLQTTKRSGWLMEPRIVALQSGLFDDLGHDLAQVVVGLVDHQLPGAAVAVVQDVVDAVQIVGRPQVLGMLHHAAQNPPRQLLGRHARGLGQVDQLPLEPVAGGEELVLVEHLVRVATQFLAGVEMLAQLLHERLHE